MEKVRSIQSHEILDDSGRDGYQNVGLFQQPDVADRPRGF
jgi:hypothetical protein